MLLKFRIVDIKNLAHWEKSSNVFSCPRNLKRKNLNKENQSHKSMPLQYDTVLRIKPAENRKLLYIYRYLVKDTV